MLLCVSLLGAAAIVREFDFSILKRRIDGNSSTVRVKRGETVQIRWRADEPVLLHVHGYDLEVRLSPEAPASMRFQAAIAGRFAITAHEFGADATHGARPRRQRETTLLYIEVLPE